MLDLFLPFGLFHVFFLVINVSNSFSQDFFDEFESLIEIEKPVLLPEKILVGFS